MTTRKKAVPVTQPFLPPLEEFIPYLEKIWQNKWLTNNGPFHEELEQRLCEYLGVEYLSLFANGTLALITALQTHGITGEVITTPFSFVATAHALCWNGIRPVFVDIDPVSMNLDPGQIEAAITERTQAILPVHVYGRPCDVTGIQTVAEKHGLRVIYDAAHAFGVKLAGRPVMEFGDLSILSFHATKVFNTFEGGAIVCHDAATKRRIDQLKNFGFVDETTVELAGINGKMNELQAAAGLMQLQYMDTITTARARIDAVYREALADVPGIRFIPPAVGATDNYAYFPILVEPGHPLGRDGLYHRLRDCDILARRYFYPLISEFPIYRELPSASPANLPVATAISRQVLCLPIYPALGEDAQAAVIEIVRASAQG